MLNVGDLAPSFTLPSTSGKNQSLKDLRGSKVVLYFYPRDDTPGCTQESCDFRDALANLGQASAVVLGISRDSLTSHAKFRSKYALPFDLLCDADSAVSRAYGAYGTKKMYGKEVEGTIRSTFLIDAKGRIAAIWSPVKVAGHVAAVLAAVTGSAETAAKTEPARPKGKAARKQPKRTAQPKAKPATATTSSARRKVHGKRAR